MVAIVCTVMVCISLLLCVTWVLTFMGRCDNVAQQPMITEEELERAYKDNADVPDFQNIIKYINEEFSGVVTEDNDG